MQVLLDGLHCWAYQAAARYLSPATPGKRGPQANITQANISGPRAHSAMSGSAQPLAAAASSMSRSAAAAPALRSRARISSSACLYRL